METNNLEVTASPEVIEYIDNIIKSVEMNDPVPTIIYGHFSDEDKSNYRIALREKAEIENGVGPKGYWVSIPGEKSLFVSEKLVNIVSGKKIVLVGDKIEFQ